MYVCIRIVRIGIYAQQKPNAPFKYHVMNQLHFSPEEWEVSRDGAEMNGWYKSEG